MPLPTASVVVAHALLDQLHADFAGFDPFGDDDRVDLKRLVLPDLRADVEVRQLQVPRPAGIANADNQQRHAALLRFAGRLAGVVLAGVLAVGEHHDRGGRSAGERLANHGPQVGAATIGDERREGGSLISGSGWAFVRLVGFARARECPFLPRANRPSSPARRN